MSVEVSLSIGNDDEIIIMKDEEGEMTQESAAAEHDNCSIATVPPPPLPNNKNTRNNKNQSINDYYGHKIGFFQTLSLILNAGLMVYAQVGLSGVVLSSLNPDFLIVPSEFQSSTEDSINSGSVGGGEGGEGQCNTQDQEIWKLNGGNSTLVSQATYCLSTYNGGCFLDTTCVEGCFQELYGYSTDCIMCIGGLLPCGLARGCTFVCMGDAAGEECSDCLIPCADDFYACSGLPDKAFEVVMGDSTIAADGAAAAQGGDTTSSATVVNAEAAITSSDQCNNYDPNAVKNWYTVYNLTYGKSIIDAWNGGAKFLAVAVIIFSGIWPYVKNIILVMVWYIPMSEKWQTFTLLWLSRLSKYTLVDVFAVIGVLVGVQLQLNLGGVEVITRAEPRFGIISFFLATLWEFFQIELIKVMYERMLQHQQQQDGGSDGGAGGERLFFARLNIPVLMLLATIALYVVGAVSEFIYIESSNGSGGMCLKSYNLVTVGNALVNELNLSGNGALGQTWFLYLVYVLLILAFPVLTHVIQIVFIAARFQSKTLKTLIKWASAISCIASVEVLLIGTFAVESKFEEFIKSIAGAENSDLIDIKSGLGVGFYILIPYCFVASFLQMSLLVRRDDPNVDSASVGSLKGGEVGNGKGQGTPIEDDIETP